MERQIRRNYLNLNQMNKKMENTEERSRDVGESENAVYRGYQKTAYTF